MAPPSDARRRFIARYDQARDALTSATSAAEGVERLLRGSRKYLVLAANNAEMRGGSGMLLMVWGGIAAAQTTNDTTYPTVSTTPTSDPCTTTTSGVCGTVGTVVSVGRVRASSLLFTGGDVALLTVLGIAVLGSGVSIVVLSRRRSNSARA